MRVSQSRWRKTMLGLAVTGLCAGTAVPAGAELLGVLPGFPVIFGDQTGQTSYDPHSDLLLVRTAPQLISIDAGTTCLFDLSQPGSANVSLLINDAGQLNGGTIEVTGTLNNPACAVASGTLLTGKVTAFGFKDNPSGPDGTATDLYDFQFDITGGKLVDLGLFPAGGQGAATVASEGSTFNGRFTEAFGDKRAKLSLGPLPGPVGDIAVDARCFVKPVSQPGTGVCTKPVTTLRFVWDGPGPVNITAFDGSVGSRVVQTISGIDTGDLVTVEGFSGRSNDVQFQISGAVNGVSEFHISCSDQDMNGPEDCGKLQGDGKRNQSGLVNRWLFAGMTGFSCPIPGNGQASYDNAQDACVITGQGGQGCKAGFSGKPATITFAYTGAGCAASNNAQGSKARCSGSVGGAPTVTVAVTGKSGKGDDDDDDDDKKGKGGLSVTPQTVALGGSFTVSGRFGAESTFVLSGAGGRETNLIHTSCSQPLRAGDVFGSLTVVAINSDKGETATLGGEVQYFCKVTNTSQASGLRDVRVFATNIKPGSLPEICRTGPIALPKPGDSSTFPGITRFVTTTTEDVAIATGVDDGGNTVIDTDVVPVRVRDGVAPACAEGFAQASNGLAQKVDVGRTLWFSSVIKPKSAPPSGATLECRNSRIVYSDGGQTRVLEVPGARITFSASASTATTVFNSADNRWDTTVPANTSASIFTNGLAVPVHTPLPAGTSVSYTCDFVTSTPGVQSVDWKWAAAVYTGNPGSVVQPVDQGSVLAGTPTAIPLGVESKGSATQASGNGGSDKTGNYSRIATAQPCGTSVAPPPSQAFKCDGKITELSMTWNGPDGVTVSANGQTFAGVVRGQTVTVGGYSGSPNDVTWRLSGAVNGTSEFHLSCSDRAMDGVEDCGTPQGNGKQNKSGLINDWLLKGLLTTRGQRLVCP